MSVVGMMPLTKLDVIIDDARSWEVFIERLRASGDARDAFLQGVAEAQNSGSNPGPSDSQLIRKSLLKCFNSSPTPM